MTEKTRNSINTKAGKAKKDIVITIGGLHGTGKSTQARRLAEVLGLRYVSAGTFFRAIAKERGLTLEEMLEIAEKDPEVDRILDERTKEESRKRGVIIDAALSGWMAENPDIRILLTAPRDMRVKRIATRDHLSEEEARKRTLDRETSDKSRYMKYYGIDVKDTSNYDVILNTALFSPEGTARILKKVVDEYSPHG